jgi:nucleoid DNA-binding protein
MKNSLSRLEMIKLVSEESGITSKAANKAINLIFDLLHNAVANQRSFVIPGVGTVRGYLRPPKMVIDPRNGQKIMSKEKLVVKISSYFKPVRRHKYNT